MCIYLISNYILPRIGFKLDVIVNILISIFIALLGFLILKEIFDRIISISIEAKLIADGDISRGVTIERPDEVGELSGALNQIAQRMRSNMDELKHYSDTTTEINLEIQKRVLVLSSLLQISSLISQGTKLEDIIKITTEKSRLLANSEVAYLLFREEGQETFYMKTVDGINSGNLLKIRIEPKEALFDKVVNKIIPLILDAENVLPEGLAESFYEKFKLKNTMALPVYLRGRVMGILGIGNSQQHFLYRKEDIELLDIFAKQIAIAIENDILMHQVEKLEIRDALTGLYNETFIRNRLQEEIKRAIIYQRPCAFILLDIDNFRKFYQNFGSLQSEAILKKIAFLIKDSITEIDRAARAGDDEFALVLPEKNKRKALELADDIRKKIEFIFSEEQDVNKRITISGGLSENPLDGTEVNELFSKAKERLQLAKTQGKNRIVG